jgi:Zn finger protein HypA/HybF involved in hydrogenase expression
MLCLDCYCKFELTEKQREMLSQRIKFVIICPDCKGENIAVNINRSYG